MVMQGQERGLAMVLRARAAVDTFREDGAEACAKELLDHRETKLGWSLGIQAITLLMLTPEEGIAVTEMLLAFLCSDWLSQRGEVGEGTAAR